VDSRKPSAFLTFAQRTLSIGKMMAVWLLPAVAAEVTAVSAIPGDFEAGRL
jgi:hypothetical protein